MSGFSGSEFVANATYIRLHAERGAQLEDLGKQVRILADGAMRRMLRETTQAEGDDDAPGAGG